MPSRLLIKIKPPPTSKQTNKQTNKKPHSKKTKTKTNPLVESLFRKFTFETMQILALCTSDIIWWQFIIVSEIQGCVCFLFFFLSSAVIWKQLSCQGQKNISSVKQYKKTHNEKFGKWRERVRLILRLGWLHGFGYLQAHLNLAGSPHPPPPSLPCHHLAFQMCSGENPGRGGCSGLGHYSWIQLVGFC